MKKFTAKNLAQIFGVSTRTMNMKLRAAGVSLGPGGDVLSLALFLNMAERKGDKLLINQRDLSLLKPDNLRRMAETREKNKQLQKDKKKQPVPPQFAKGEADHPLRVVEDMDQSIPDFGEELFEPIF